MFFRILVVVPTYEGKDNKRNYSKDDYCFYCKKKFTSKISKHILTVHSEETEVAQAILKSKNDRTDILYKLQQLGNYQHNTKVITQF